MTFRTQTKKEIELKAKIESIVISKDMTKEEFEHYMKLYQEYHNEYKYTCIVPLSMKDT